MCICYTPLCPFQYFGMSSSPQKQHTGKFGKTRRSLGTCEHGLAGSFTQLTCCLVFAFTSHLHLSCSVPRGCVFSNTSRVLCTSGAQRHTSKPRSLLSYFLKFSKDGSVSTARLWAEWLASFTRLSVYKSVPHGEMPHWAEVTSPFTCDVSIVFLEFMSFHPLAPVLLIDVDFVIIGAKGDLWKKSQRLIFELVTKKGICFSGLFFSQAVPHGSWGS